MMSKIYKKLSIFSLAVLGMFGLASAGLCAPSSTPAEVLDAVAGSGIDTAVSLVQTVVTTYWPYILVFGILVAIFAWLAKFSKLGSR